MIRGSAKGLDMRFLDNGDGVGEARTLGVRPGVQVHIIATP